MESLLIQFMMLSLTLPPYTATKASVPSSWWSSPRCCEAVVVSLGSQLFSKLNKPHFLSCSHRAVLQPHNHPLNTTQYIGMHCSVMFTLLICEAELIPTQPSPRCYNFEFFPSQVKNITSILAEFHESIPPPCLGLLERQLFPWLPNPQATVFWVLFKHNLNS